MDEHAEAGRDREVVPSPELDGSMSGVGVPSDRHSIEGLGYSGDEPEPGPDEHVRPDNVGAGEDRPAG